MKISACLITKNEENNLRACLDSLKNVVHEIVLVDHHSEDRTREIALSYGVKFYSRDWTDNFADARNFAIQYATGDWIVFLDADEYLTQESGIVLHQVLEQASVGNCTAISSMLVNVEVSTGHSLSTLPEIKIFRNDPNIRYQGAIHEYLVDGCQPLKIANAIDYIKIIHTGYSKQQIQDKNKSQRNLDLLFKELERYPSNSDVLFYISEAFLMDGNTQKAMEYARKSIEQDQFRFRGAAEKNYLNLINCMHDLGYANKHLLQTIQEAIDQYPHYPDFHVRKADVLRFEERMFDAIEEYDLGIECFDHAVAIQSQILHSIDMIYYQVGVLYYKTNQLQAGVSSFVKALRVNPYHFLSLQNLVKLFSKSEKTDAIVDFLKNLYPEPSTKNCIYQFKAVLDSNHAELATHYFLKLQDVQRQKLMTETSFLCLLLGQYKDAYLFYKDLYQQDNQDHYAIHGTVAAFLTGTTEFLKELQEFVMPPVKRLIGALLGGITCLPTDRDEFLKFWEILIRLHAIEAAVNFLPWLEQLELLSEAASLAMVHEQHELAIKVYTDFLRLGQPLDCDTHASVLYQMAVCARNLGQWEQSKQFCLDAQKLSPESYSPYELLTQISHHTKLEEAVWKRIEHGSRLFPDSNYLKSLSWEITLP